MSRPGRRYPDAVARRTNAQDSVSPALERVVESRYSAAEEQVRKIRSAYPGESVETLADRLVRGYVRDLAIGGAMAGGAAAAPFAGATVLAAAGLDAAYSAGRLGEMIMAIGILYGHEQSTVEQRTAWMWAVMGMADGAAVGLTGLAARVGTRGGARLLARLPSSAVAAANQRAGRRFAARLARSRGPWALASVLPYGIGAGVGAAGNVALVLGVGRAAKEFFARTPPPGGRVAEVVDEETVLLEEDLPRSPGPSGTSGRRADDTEIVDAEVVERPRAADGD